MHTPTRNIGINGKQTQLQPLTFVNLKKSLNIALDLYPVNYPTGVLITDSKKCLFGEVCGL